MSQLSQTSIVSCSHYQALDHFLSVCPYFAHQLATKQEQASMAFQRLENGPSSLNTTQGGEITQTFHEIVNQILWF